MTTVVLKFKVENFSGCAIRSFPKENEGWWAREDEASFEFHLNQNSYTNRLEIFCFK
jgi:hypothetical protein